MLLFLSHQSARVGIKSSLTVIKFYLPTYSKLSHKYNIQFVVLNLQLNLLFAIVEVHSSVLMFWSNRTSLFYSRNEAEEELKRIEMEVNKVQEDLNKHEETLQKWHTFLERCRLAHDLSL